MGQHSGIGVLDKAVAVLTAAAANPLTLAELCAVTGLPRATAHRRDVCRAGVGGRLRADLRIRKTRGLCDLPVGAYPRERLNANETLVPPMGFEPTLPP